MDKDGEEKGKGIKEGKGGVREDLRELRISYGILVELGIMMMEKTFFFVYFFLSLFFFIPLGRLE